MTGEYSLEALTDERVAMCEEDGDRQWESFFRGVLDHSYAASMDAAHQRCLHRWGSRSNNATNTRVIAQVANHGHW